MTLGEKRSAPPLAALVLAALCVACGGGGQSPELCGGASCPQVAGSYFESVASNFVDCGNLHTLTFGGGTDNAYLEESGSQLTDESSVASIGGVLHTDGSASFGPVAAEASPVDDQGNPDPNGMGEPGKLYLDGWFVDGGFEGTYLFVADMDGCEIDVKTTWTR